MKKVTYYFGKHSPLSNFHHCIFFDKNHVRYTSSEQYYQSHKALFFKDKLNYKMIMLTSDPLVIKRLGRKINNFSERKWSPQVRRELMFDGCLLKFKTHKHLFKHLLLANHTIIEANPHDRFWGPPLNNMGRLLVMIRAKILCPR